MAGRPAIGGLRNYRQTSGNAGNVQLLGRARKEHFRYARRRARLEDSVRRAANSFFAPGDADEALGFVVIRRDLVVGDGPIRAKAIAGVGSEIVIGEAQRDAAVMIGAPAHYTRAEPGKLVARVHGVRLAGKFPAAKAGSKVAEVPGGGTEISLPARADAAMRHLVGP